MKKVYAFLAAAMVMASASAQTAYLRGSASELNWDNDTEYTAVDGKITFTLTGVNNFKISTTGGADWTAFDQGAMCLAGESNKIARAQLGTPVALAAGTNDIYVPVQGDYKFELAADFSTLTATSLNDTPVVTYTTLYLRGAATELSWENNVEIAAENGVFKFELTNASQFKMSVTGGASWDEFNPGSYMANIESANVGKEIDLTAGDNNTMLPWEGDWSFVVADDMSYLVATTTTPEPVGQVAKVYLRGGMNNWGNDEESLNKFEMTTEDGITYWFDCEGETSIPAGTEFKIADSSWTKINYGGGDEIIPQPDVDEDMAFEWFYNGKNSVMGLDYTGTIKAILPSVLASADYNLMVVVYPEIVEHKTTGVNDIVVEDEAPVYYNLQGVRVATPENGLYIVRRGAKVSKVLVK